MGKTPLKYPIALWIILAFVVWICIFFPFLSSRLGLFEDAPSYYDHTKFFIENLGKGVYPLWDPFWYNGSSNDFFLRRIGAFNPFYLIILVFEFFKIPFTTAYLMFLALYFWAGAIAFYLLAMRLYNNRLIAYGGYLIFLFSSLGTRLFDSYMMLVTVPIVWFFYCLISMAQMPRKHLFLGMCLSFMILSTTYIPFYFFSILAAFLVFFALFYFKHIPPIIKSWGGFFKKNKVLVVLSLIVIALSFVPALSFFHKSNQGQVVMPYRHGTAASPETLVVPTSALDWGAVEDVLFSYFFSDWSRIRFAVIYIPFFAFVVFALGLFCRISRRAVFMFLLGFVFLCCIIPRGMPFYDFLYQHLFFLKYFRNLHFFLWFALIPLFILLILEHWKLFSETKLPKRMSLAYVLVVHAIALLFVVIRKDAILSTYLMLGLSGAFWTLLVLRRLKNPVIAFALLSAAIMVQPIEVYNYLCHRPKPYSSYQYHFSYTNLKLKKPEIQLSDNTAKGGGMYYASGNYNTVYQNVTNYSFYQYLQYAFVLVDSVQEIDPHSVDFSLIEKHFLNNDNKAFVFNQGTSLKTQSNDPSPDGKGLRIEKEDESFKVVTFNANYLKLSVNLPYEKFLVYNDSYDPQWKARINGNPVVIYQANVAFKGIWLPAGKNTIEFTYERWQTYAFNILLLIASLAFLLGIIYFQKRQR